MRELWDRLLSKTPKFWKKVQKVLLAVAFVSGLGLSQMEQLPKWDWLDDALRMGVFAGLFGTFLAQLTKDTNETQEQNGNKTEQ
jgi:uncharacterized membrane protein YeiH